jgi:hypothetical protein
VLFEEQDRAICDSERPVLSSPQGTEDVSEESGWYGGAFTFAGQMLEFVEHDG